MESKASHNDGADDDEMPVEIDFSQGMRGKFFKPSTPQHLPAQLEAEAQHQPQAAKR